MCPPIAVNRASGNLRYRLARLLAMAAVTVLAGTACAASAFAANALQKLGFSSLPGGDVQPRVLADDDEAVVLGGIYRRTDKRQKNSVAILGDIPGLGFLFRNGRKTNDRSEWLIFGAPKIIDGALWAEVSRGG
ncbi:MAG: hypothetical protein B7Z66_12035 [Chromatiales bacterium 21-64-14]|nr:MAG: hypothetical protein B7Z66_12035 [Chromatiales bacterium 21-64-14]